ncbi:MAG TPA: penicillin-binding protein 1C [Xanthobacteraceae bacterium]|nr:penicillin-binding protein 1C [Xanthobacteraceae bacterium]
MRSGTETGRRRRTLLAVGFAAGVGLGAFALWVHAPGPAPLGEEPAFSRLVLDREGRLLRAYATEEGRWRLPVARAEVDPRYVAALIAYEDRRFFTHHGVDPWALGRAAMQFLQHGRIVSGGSTLTMQVARLIEPRTERSLRAKWRQMVRAIVLERRLSKDEILALYLNFAPYGGNLEGVRAASLAYFGREPRRLTPAEIALLVALPQSPETRRPDRFPAAARRARDRVLDRLAGRDFFSTVEIAQAKQAPVPQARRAMPALAAHAADEAVASDPDARVHRLTIDAPLQRALEALASERAPLFGREVSVAILVLDNATGEVLARVGSAGYFDTERAGQVDMTRAVRSPGSSLKPFIYGLGIEDGVIHPETLIDDRPIRYGSYAPENFDLTFQGTVSVRTALQMSLNVPAVAVLDAVGASRFTSRLRQAGAALVLPEGEIPGLAMGLGGVGVRLTDLAMLYAGIARLGLTIPPAERRGAPPGAQRRLLDPAAAWSVANILLGTPPPENAVRGRIAFKTGTSYGYRDAWSVGFDGKRTVAVWVGRADGAPVPGITGRSAAAPILFDAFARMGTIPAPLPPPPRGALITTNAKLPPPLRHFRPGGPVHASGASAPRILFPPNGARLEFVGESEPVPVKVSGGSGPVTVLANGLPVAQARRRGTVFWRPDGPGFVRLTVTDERGGADSVVIKLQSPNRWLAVPETSMSDRP